MGLTRRVARSTYLRADACWTQARLAVEPDSSQSQASKLPRSVHRPSRASRRWIEMRIGTPADSWERPAKCSGRVDSDELAITLDLNNLRAEERYRSERQLGLEHMSLTPKLTCVD